MAGKKGLAGGYANQIAAVGAAWSYIYYPAKDRLSTLFQHVPMVTVSIPSQDAVNALAGCSHWLFFNEPDFYSSNPYYLSAAAAAILYHDATAIILATSTATKFIVGGLFWPNNLTWLNSFRDEYKLRYGAFPTVHGWHVHNYAETGKYTMQQWRDLLAPIRQWISGVTPGGEFWLTEFGCLASEPLCQTVMRDQVAWLEAEPWVTRYAWWTHFTASRQGSLFVGDASLNKTALGALYATLGGAPVPPPFQPPPFTAGLRRYNDPALTGGCPAVLEYGYSTVAVRRYRCQVVGEHGLHVSDDGSVRVEWRSP